MSSSNGKIAVIDFGMGNIHSMLKALRLYHDDVVFTKDHDVLKNASAFVLPGDGAFTAAMEHLEKDGLDSIITDHVKAGKPLLGVCIGFQVLFENSDESPEGKSIPGLGLIPGHVRKFQFQNHDTRIPHMGWNRLISKEPDFSHYMYFIHSYRAVDVHKESIIAECQYGDEKFCAAVKNNGILAMQFHPEKSDHEGLKLIENWVKSI
ncbi:MAG: imidazole glycerol phosphate synthase subunit HisH [Spirochaetia bacterium]|nr:imidazole glycerol phosphate synthase subunit HisH [Spirochaetia bacterium]